MLDLEQLDEQRFRGESRNIVGRRVFGGQVLGQALIAAARTVEERHTHSLHSYFLRPGDVREPIDYQVEKVRDGGTLSTRRVIAWQREKPIFELSASFKSPEDGLEHQDPAPPAPPPEELETELETVARLLAEEDVSDNFRKAMTRERPIDFRPLEPIHPMRPGKRPPQRGLWLRTMGKLPDDPALHRAVLAYASDHSMIAVALQPYGLNFLNRGLQAATLDHAMWFHHEFRADDWLLYAMDSPVATDGRGLVRGQIFDRGGRLVASVAQEGVMRYSGEDTA